MSLTTGTGRALLPGERFFFFLFGLGAIICSGTEFRDYDPDEVCNQIAQ